FTTSCVTTHS
ncbi:tyrosine--tRNA ligase, partial [Vibrio parahaemolyticus V-223/04]